MTDKLFSKWTVWYHNCNDKNWDLNSYKNLFEFDTIEDFWKLINSIEKYYDNYCNDMIFIMIKLKVL